MTDDTKHIKNEKRPAPELCGYVASYEDNNLVILIRKTFDIENKGRSWARPIIEAFPTAYTTLIVDLGSNQIVSSTVYAGLVELYQSFHSRCPEGVHIRNCSPAVQRALKMLHLDSLFTISLQDHVL